MKPNLVDRTCELLKWLCNYRKLHNTTTERAVMTIFPLAADQTIAQMWSNGVWGVYVTDRQTDKQIIIIISKNGAFSLVKCFDDMCRMGRWSFWSWCDVNRSIFDKDMSEKIFTCSFPVTFTLTFRPHTCSPSYSCPVSSLHRIRSLYGFPVWIKLEARDGRTDGRTDGQGAKLNAAPLGKAHNSVPKVTRMLSIVSFVSSYSVHISSTCGRLMTLCPSKWSLCRLWSLMTARMYSDSRPKAALVARRRRSLRWRCTTEGFRIDHARRTVSL